MATVKTSNNSNQDFNEIWNQFNPRTDCGISFTSDAMMTPQLISFTKTQRVHSHENDILSNNIYSHFYSKTNHMHNISNLFYFGITLYTFRTVSPSIIRSLRLYINHQVYVIQALWLFEIYNISNLFYFGITLYTFRTVSPSIIRSLRLYIQHQVYVIQVLVAAAF